MSYTKIQWLLSPKATLRVTLSTKTWDREGSWLNVLYPFPFPVANTIIPAEPPGLGETVSRVRPGDRRENAPRDERKIEKDNETQPTART